MQMIVLFRNKIIILNNIVILIILIIIIKTRIILKQLYEKYVMITKAKRASIIIYAKYKYLNIVMELFR